MKVLNCGHITVWKDKCSLQNHSSLMESYNISNLFYRTLFALRIICLSVQLFIRRWIRRMQVSPSLIFMGSLKDFTELCFSSFARRWTWRMRVSPVALSVSIPAVWPSVWHSSNNTELSRYS